MIATNIKTSKCPIFESADLIGKKWTIALLQEISANGDRGFNYIFRRLGKISPKILSRRLREMEISGIIERDISRNKAPARAKYKVTEKGAELQKIIGQLRKWQIRYSKEKFECSQDCVSCQMY